ncbi:MAG: ribonuclease III [Bacilli bacterium]|nr:ribonuclease III [Bacilli bacterium]
MELLNKLNIKPHDISLYETAFSHTSYANENDKESYERLEFLGDAVLELLMSDYLYNNLNKTEGEMTKLRAHYVCETALYEYAKKLELNKYLKLGKGEEETGGRNRKTIVSDIFESFLGAIYLDQGIDVAKTFFLENVIPYIKNHEVDFFDDYKSKLQECVQTDKKSLEYKIIDETGPSHNKRFTAEVIIDGIVYGAGTSHSKKSAEQEAAKNALEKARERI